MKFVRHKLYLRYYNKDTIIKYLILIVLLFHLKLVKAQVTSAADGNYSANTTWVGNAPDAIIDNVLIVDNVLLDVDIVIKQNFEIQGSLLGTNGKDITVSASGNIIMGDLDMDGKFKSVGSSTITVKAGDTIYVDDLEINGNSHMLVEAGAVIYVSNNLKVKNNGILTVESGAEIHVSNDFQIEDDGTVLVKSGAIVEVAHNFKIIDDGAFTLEAGAELNVVNDFKIEDDAVVVIDGDVTVGNKFETKHDAVVTGIGTIQVNGVTNIKNNSTVFGSTGSGCLGCTFSQGCSYNSTINSWNGTVNSDWFIAGNWSEGVPTNISQVYIQASAPIMPIISGIGAQCFHIGVESGASLEILGTDTLNIIGNGDFQGDFIGNSSTINFSGGCGPSTISAKDTIRFHNVIINNSDSVVTVSGKYELEGLLSIQAGTFFTNDSLRIISNMNGTGSIGEITGIGISGKIIMERYIDAGETYWRYIGSAVKDASISQFNDDFTTSGYPGASYPNFNWPSAYNYDETLGPGLGYQACIGATQVISPGEGWQIWCGDTITGTQPFVFDLEGEVNQGNINLPVTYTFTGTDAEDGFNLIANPYPSTIDWDDSDWIKINMANATYIQNPDNQQYATYVAGASTNGGSRYIASQQSFWVQAIGTSPTLSASEGVKSNIDQAFIKASQPIYSKGLSVKIKKDNQFDEVVIRHISGASESFEYAYDANKWWGGWGQYPQLSVVNNELKDLTIHSFDKSFQEWILPLRTVVFENGIYTLSFNNISELGVPCLILEDTYTQETYLIEEGFNIAFEMYDTTYVPRFMIHIGRNYELTSESVACYGEASGEISLDLDMNQNVNYKLTHNGNTVINNAFADPLVIDSLQSGNYLIKVPDLENSCDYKKFEISINEPLPLEVSGIVAQALNGNDGYINLLISGGTSPYTYFWNTGDSTSNLLKLGEGAYDVIVTDMNNCTSVAHFDIESLLSTQQIHDKEVSFIYDANNSKIFLDHLKFEGVGEFIVYDLTGQQIALIRTNVTNGACALELPIELANGAYVLSFPIANFNQKFIYLQNY